MTTAPHGSAPGQFDVAAALDGLARNFRWVWDGATQDVFDATEAELWRRQRDPFALIRALPPERLAELAADPAYVDQVRAAHDDLAAYLADRPERPEVAYFCMEHGIAPALRTYAGGLGMLAGCIEKTASDLRVPMVAVGLMYQWWPRQRLSYGWQEEDWQRVDPAGSGLEAVGDLRVTVDVAGAPVSVRLWRARVGRVDLYLLDTDVPENAPHLREITDRLYGGDAEHRLVQEMILGIGGVRALAALGLEPAVFHANEGHAGFMCLERTLRAVQAGRSLTDAVDLVRAGTLFTTHTAVPAGFDLFDRGLVEKYFAGWAAECGVSTDWLMGLGHFPDQGPDEPFNMAVLCARMSGHVNAVSRLHREVTEHSVLGRLWPGQAAPVVAVTNGVHPRTWTPPELAERFERYVGPGWDYADATRWDGVWRLPDEDLWRVKRTLRARMVDFVRWYLPVALRRSGWGDDLAWTQEVLDPDALTVVVARRAAEYKETDLLVSRPDRLRALTGDTGRPVQVLFAGLAHPKDQGGKERIRRIVEFSLDPAVRTRVLFLPGYDMRLALALLGGADVWLNHPRRGDEACGTSFMKAVFNGARVLTTADGGADELIVSGDNGWIIGDRAGGASREAMADSVYGWLEHVIAPEFHDRDADGLPRAWLDGVKRSLSGLAWQVSSAPMVAGYDRLYRDAVRRTRQLTA
jgi:starch phosphorylase